MKEVPPVYTPRSARIIARRALVLSSVVSVAHGDSRIQVCDWLHRETLWSELSPREHDFLTTAEPLRETIIAFKWGMERLVPLLWAIHKLPAMPLLTSQCDAEPMKQSVIWLPDASLPFIESAVLRTGEEISVEYEKIYAAHWKVRDAQRRKLPAPDGLDAGLIYERHYGFNWLTGYCGQSWDDVLVDT